MKKYLFLLLSIVIMTLPLMVHAEANKVLVECDGYTILSNQTMTCYISIDPIEILTGLDGVLVLPKELQLVGKIEALSNEWSGIFEEGETRLALFGEEISSKKAVAKFVIKAGEITESKNVNITVGPPPDSEFSVPELSLGIDKIDEIAGASVSQASIALLPGEKVEEEPPQEDDKTEVGDNTIDNNTTVNNSVVNNTVDKESPETGANPVTVIAGALVLAVGAFVLTSVTRKSRFN